MKTSMAGRDNSPFQAVSMPPNALEDGICVRNLRNHSRMAEAGNPPWADGPCTRSAARIDSRLPGG